MTRIRQFANDMGISYNKAKSLVQKGEETKRWWINNTEKFTCL